MAPQPSWQGSQQAASNLGYRQTSPVVVLVCWLRNWLQRKMPRCALRPAKVFLCDKIKRAVSVKKPPVFHGVTKITAVTVGVGVGDSVGKSDDTVGMMNGVSVGTGILVGVSVGGFNV